MERAEKFVPQWMEWITVEHGPSFGHRVSVVTVGKSSATHPVGSVAWKGIGMPPGLLEELEALVVSALAEHLVTRYGIAQTFDWPDVPGPL